MKQEESKILKDLGKDPGFKVPENYFEDFNKRMLESLPEVEIKEEKSVVKKPKTLWVSWRPVFYAAATVAGVFAMITVFNSVNGSTGSQIQKLANDIDKDKNADELIMSGDANEYDVLNYQDSVNMNLEKASDMPSK